MFLETVYSYFQKYMKKIIRNIERFLNEIYYCFFRSEYDVMLRKYEYDDKIFIDDLEYELLIRNNTKKIRKRLRNFVLIKKTFDKKTIDFISDTILKKIKKNITNKITYSFKDFLIINIKDILNLYLNCFVRIMNYKLNNQYRIENNNNILRIVIISGNKTFTKVMSYKDNSLIIDYYLVDLDYFDNFEKKTIINSEIINKRCLKVYQIDEIL